MVENPRAFWPALALWSLLQVKWSLWYVDMTQQWEGVIAETACTPVLLPIWMQELLLSNTKLPAVKENLKVFFPVKAESVFAAIVIRYALLQIKVVVLT